MLLGLLNLLLVDPAFDVTYSLIPKDYSSFTKICQPKPFQFSKTNGLDIENLVITDVGLDYMKLYVQ